MIDPVALQTVRSVLTGWLDRREREAIAYLIEENRLLRRQRGSRRLQLTDDDRRQLAMVGGPLGTTAFTTCSAGTSDPRRDSHSREELVERQGWASH